MKNREDGDLRCVCAEQCKPPSPVKLAAIVERMCSDLHLQRLFGAIG